MSAMAASMTVLILVSGIAGAVYIAFYGTQRLFDERVTEVAVRMRVAYGNPNSADADSPSFANGLFRWVAARMPAPAMKEAQREKLSQTLNRAGYTRSSAIKSFQVAQLSLTVVLALLLFLTSLMFGAHGVKPLLFMLMGAGLGAFAPSYYIGRKARHRQQEIASQLSDVLDLLVVCVEAGLGLGEAIKIVGSETERQSQAIGKELATVSAEISAGSSLGQALRSFAERTAVEDIKPLAATMIQSEQLGAQIGPALRSISDTLRNTRRMRAEEAAQKTTVKILFPLVLFILPAMMSVIIGPAMIQIMHTLNK